MDVRVEVSLLGGHVWDFVCDDADPLVFGLVSALPGVTADPNLPLDGLIQVERRSGDRIYFTRSSLVAVAIFPSVGETGTPARSRVERSPSVVAPTPCFTTVAGVFRSEACEALAALKPKAAQTSDWPGQIGLDDTDVDARVGEDIVKLATHVRSSLLASSLEEATLDVHFFRLDPGGSATFEVSPSDLIWMCAAVPSEPLSTASYGITVIEADGATAQETAPRDEIVLAANEAYAGLGHRARIQLRATGSPADEWATVVRIAMRSTAL